MTKRRKASFWRRVFLRVLARSGNVRASAFEAGVDPGTAYDHRVKDAGFAAKWAAALKKARAGAAKNPLHRRSGGPPPRPGEELVLRRTKHGDKMVRAAAGRWCAATEEAYLAAYAETACIRWAAKAAGVSANTIHYRMRLYPEFATRCAAAEEEAKTHIHGLLVSAAVASFAPRRGRRGTPAVSVDQGIKIYQLKGPGSAAERRGRHKRPEPTIEQVRDEVLQRIAAIRRHRDRKGTEPDSAAPSATASGGGPEPGRSLPRSDLGLPGTAQPDSPRPGEDQ